MILDGIQSYFGGIENFYKHGVNSISFDVQTIKELQTIISHFDKYPLITQKRADYELFKLVINYIQKGEHLTMEGLIKIICIKASMNWGISDELLAAFPNIIPVSKVLVLDKEIKDPN